MVVAAKKEKIVEELFSAGAHFGYSKSRRHPSVRDYIYGKKNENEIFDLEKTKELLASAEAFAGELAAEGKTLLFVGNKAEAREIVKQAAERVSMPYVAGRWIGGILTNFAEISKRTGRLKSLWEQKEKGELEKYTKKEQSRIAKEVSDLEAKFLGIVSLERVPDALYVVDSEAESIALREARQQGVPVISLSSSDCNIEKIEYPIVGNDSSVSSITLITERIANAFRDGLSKKEAKKETKATKTKEEK